MLCFACCAPQALGKAPTFGIRDSRSIKDQRESLPIYKLRDQLIQAVDDNQASGNILLMPRTFAMLCWGVAANFELREKAE